MSGITERLNGKETSRGRVHGRHNVWTRRPRSTLCASRGNALADVPARPRARGGALERVRRAASASPRVRRRPSAVPRRRRLLSLVRRTVVGIPARGARARRRRAIPPRATASTTISTTSTATMPSPCTNRGSRRAPTTRATIGTTRRMPPCAPSGNPIGEISAPGVDSPNTEPDDVGPDRSSPSASGAADTTQSDLIGGHPASSRARANPETRIPMPPPPPPPQRPQPTRTTTRGFATHPPPALPSPRGSPCEPSARSPTSCSNLAGERSFAAAGRSARCASPISSPGRSWFVCLGAGTFSIAGAFRPGWSVTAGVRSVERRWTRCMQTITGTQT